MCPTPCGAVGRFEDGRDVGRAAARADGDADPFTADCTHRRLQRVEDPEVTAMRRATITVEVLVEHGAEAGCVEVTGNNETAVEEHVLGVGGRVDINDQRLVVGAGNRADLGLTDREMRRAQNKVECRRTAGGLADDLKVVGESKRVQSDAASIR